MSIFSEYYFKLYIAPSPMTNIENWQLTWLTSYNKPYEQVLCQYVWHFKNILPCLNICIIYYLNISIQILTKVVWPSSKSNVCFMGAMKQAGTISLYMKSGKPWRASFPPEKGMKTYFPTQQAKISTFKIVTVTG